jgi:hypothetical protein
MTRDKKAKKAARAYADATGISYTAARRSALIHEALFEPLSIEELLEGAPQGACNGLIGEPIKLLDNPNAIGVSVDLDLPEAMSDPSVHQFDVDDTSTIVYVAEEYEGGTLACNVTSTGTLTVETTMSKSDAISAAEAGEVRILEADLNRHYSTVVFDVEVEATFNAIVNPEFQTVESFSFDGVAVIHRSGTNLW